MSKFFIGRPHVAIVIAIITVLAGLVSIRGLPIAQFPDIVPPQITVTATYNGADALTIEQAVAAPLEQQMNGVDNMLYMQSTNANDGTMQLIVTFDIGTDPNIDQVNVQNRVAQAQPNLPPDVNNFGLTIRKATGFPMLVVSLSSPKDTYDALFLANYANINITDALYRVPGVGQVRLFGASDYAMRIWVNPDRLATLQLTVPEIVRAVQQQSTVNPSGQIGAAPVPSGQEFSYTVRSQGRLQTAEEFAGIAVRSNPDGSVVRLGDVARIELGALNYGQISRVNGRAGCAIGVFQIPGSNALAVAAGVKKTMAELSRRFPTDVQYIYSLDTTLPVSEGIKEILITLAIAIVLVMFVVFLFLQNWRATLIPMIAVPVSLIGTFAVFPLLGFSINTLSLFGLVLAIGLVVDDAIVVVEAVERHIEEGMSPKDAALKAMEEVSGPVISIALILAAVFIPVGFMSGIQGRLNKQFAITIAISVMISAFNALSLSPALAALLLKPRKQATGVLSRVFGAFNRAFETATRGYVRVSSGLMRKAVVGVVLLAAFAALAAALGRRLPRSFVPEEDYGYFLLGLQLPPAASLERTDAVTRKIDQLLAHTEGIADFVTVAGFSLLSFVTADNYGFYFVGLTPWDKRKRADLDARHIVDRVNAGLSQIVPEATAFAMMPPSIPGLGQQGGFSFWLQDRTGGGLEVLDQNVQKFLDAARKRPELTGLATQFNSSVPQLFADVDRDKVLKQGVALGDVYQTMQTFLGGLFVNQFSRFGRQWRVFVQAEGADRTSPSAIAQFYVPNNDGAMVPLSALETTRPAFGAQYTNRFNVYRAALVTGAAAPGYSSTQALDALEATARRTLPPEIGFDWSDLSYQERKAGGSGATYALSLTFVFLILAALYESWSLPLAVLLSVPIAVFGAMLGLFLRKYDFDVYAQIGIIMLIGLAAKNAILIVEFAKARLEQGMDVEEAALEGAKVRLRPILMTSFAFILGCVPLWIATGSGAASRRILGTVVITGMLMATALAIFIIPLLFVLSKRLAGRFKRQAHADSPASAPLSGPDIKALVILLVAGAAAGCTVGPNYRKPVVTVPDTYRGAAPPQPGADTAVSIADQAWWDVFQDDELRELIRVALLQNLDLRIAATRILEAWAQLGITRADQFPTIDAGANASRSRVHKSIIPFPLDPYYINDFQVTARFAWEIDFWGKFRRATEAARANLLASAWGRRAVVTSLVSQVASAYFELRAFDHELDVATRTLASRRESLRLTEVKESGGAVSLLDVREAEQLVFGAEATISDLQRLIAQQENFISVLLGRNPSNVPRGVSLEQQTHLPEIPVGLPSTLLERRPDIRQAEQLLIAANANIGVAKAAYFPQISLTGSGGLRSAALSSLFATSAVIWSVGAGVTQSVFNGGRTRSRVALTKAQREQALLVYQQTIVQSLREVSDALIGYRKGREFREQQQLLSGAATDARRLAGIRYSGGATSYLEVLDSDTRMFSAELAVTQAELSELLFLVQVYRALGGGWQP